MIVEFKPEHLLMLKLQPHQSLLQAEISESYGHQLIAGGPAFSCIVDDKVMACSGVVQIWEGRWLAWALIADDAIKPRIFIQIHQAVKRFLDIQTHPRIEAYVDVAHGKAHEWIQKLGFQLEAKEMRSFLPNGQSQSLYARIS